MNLLPKSKEEFSQKEYWDLFFKRLGGKAFEWYGEYPELAEHLQKYIKVQDDILMVGCGNSSLGRDLYDIGHRKIKNIDISKVVIKQMVSQDRKKRPGLEYIQMDAHNMTFENDSFSVVLDKGTLDALLPNTDESTLDRVDRYFAEILRVLRVGGRYICISLLQEHILKKLLHFFPPKHCMFRVIRCFEPEKKSEDNGLPVFMVICTKFNTTLPRRILEINLSSIPNSIQKCDSIEQIMAQVADVQKAAFLCYHLKKTSLIDENEISFELHKPGSSETRYTVYIVDIMPELNNSPYAAFIVPAGREPEWLFSTRSGRKHLANITHNNRLAIITMHRGQEYTSLEQVQEELSEIILNLSPAVKTQKQKDRKIPFLSLGPDVGRRAIRYQGNSKHSGDYVIEDVETETGDTFRRLFYLCSQLVIQSEAKLKTIKSRKGKEKEIVDLTYLSCKHHIYMSIAAWVACEGRVNPQMVVLGLGGGGLCSFLHKFLPQASITGVEIDEEMVKIASNWFSFTPNDKLGYTVADALDYLRELDQKRVKVDAILCDVDSKDSKIGMSCPPEEFVDKRILKSISKIIGRDGLFVVNLVLRNTLLRLGIMRNLKTCFLHTISYKLQEDLNEVIICTNIEKLDDSFKLRLRYGCEEILDFFGRNGADGSPVDIVEYLNKLKINS